MVEDPMMKSYPTIMKTPPNPAINENLPGFLMMSQNAL